MGAKSSSRMGAFFYPMSANCVHVNIDKFCSRAEREFFHQIVANLP